MEQQQINEKFFTPNGKKYGHRFHKIKVHSVRNKNKDIEYAYKELVEIGPYLLESQSVTRMVNITRLNEVLNNKLGISRILSKTMRLFDEINNLIKFVQE